jgi:hypothetical protein
VKDIHISLKLFNHKWAKINMLKLNVNLWNKKNEQKKAIKSLT